MIAQCEKPFSESLSHVAFLVLETVLSIQNFWYYLIQAPYNPWKDLHGGDDLLSTYLIRDSRNRLLSQQMISVSKQMFDVKIDISV